MTEGPHPPQNARFKAPKSLRLTRRDDIARVFAEGLRAGDSLMTLYMLAGPSSPLARLGVAVSKRHGGAVRRNRIKRLCREAFRLQRPGVPPGDYMIVARPGGEFSLQRIGESLAALLRRLREHPRRRPAP